MYKGKTNTFDINTQKHTIRAFLNAHTFTAMPIAAPSEKALNAIKLPLTIVPGRLPAIRRINAVYKRCAHAEFKTVSLNDVSSNVILRTKRFARENKVPEDLKDVMIPESINIAIVKKQTDKILLWLFFAFFIGTCTPLFVYNNRL